MSNRGWLLIFQIFGPTSILLLYFHQVNWYIVAKSFVLLIAKINNSQQMVQIKQYFFLCIRKLEMISCKSRRFCRQAGKWHILEILQAKDGEKQKTYNLKGVASLRSELKTKNEETMTKNDKRNTFLEEQNNQSTSGSKNGASKWAL